MFPMARAATTADVFNAVAEGRRRAILDVLSGGEMAVGQVVHALGIPQPQVSKHLKVLSDVGLVGCRSQGRLHLYSVNGEAVAPIRQWLSNFERQWNERLDRLDEYIEEISTAKVADEDTSEGEQE
jgi:DNA-binding transcriptional ArsR family regulator